MYAAIINRRHLSSASAFLSLRAFARLLVPALVALWLVACGGGDGGSPQIPVLLTQPSDQGVVEGSAATFTVTADGAAPLAYQWASSPNGTAFTPIAGASNPSYSTGATTYAQNGTSYRVTVSNGVGSVTSSAVRVTVTRVIVAPSITVQPADQAAIAPASATFNVTAAGTSLSYQWQLSTDAGVTFASVSAPDAPSLVVSNTSGAQSGSIYRVIVSNGAGSIASNSAVLTVSPTPTAPMFTTQPVSQSVTWGQAVDFTVVVVGTPVPSIQWRINGTPLAANGMPSSGACVGVSIQGVFGSTLSLVGAGPTCDGAVFDAVASNGVAPDATSAGATLNVHPGPVAPTIATQPIDATVVAPSTATFTAAAAGAPSPSAQWQQSTDAGSTWANIIGATSASYSTPATTTADSGKRFRAVFTNAAGSAISNAATLTVTPSRATGLSLLAGAVGGPGNLDGTGSDARFYLPSSVAVDAAGNVYVADQGNQAIRKITSAGVVSTLAGSGGYGGSNDGTGSAAAFRYPSGVAVDAAGTVYVADTFNSTIRKITPAGVVSTLAGSAGVADSADGTGTDAHFSYPTGIAVDVAGNLYVADQGNHTIRKITSAGVVTTLAGTAANHGSADGTGPAASFNSPGSVAVDATGNVYVADTNNSTIRKITPAGDVTTLAGLATHAGSTDGAGAVARFSYPYGVAVDAAGNVYVADSNSSTLRKITPAGLVSTLAGMAGFAGGGDGTGSGARFNYPHGVAVDAAGNVYVADTYNSTIRNIAPAGVVATLAGSPPGDGSADGTGSAARFNVPIGVAVDAAGNVYVADLLNSTIRKITATGLVSTLAGSAGLAGNTDGTGSDARFFSPEGLAVDAAGNVYVADTSNHTIRKITPAGAVTTLAGSAGNSGSADGTGSARFAYPTGVAVDALGNVYVADYGNNTIRKITPAGEVSTLAGSAEASPGNNDGTGSAARFSGPAFIAVDSTGNLYVSDINNFAIRSVTPGGVVSTLGGRGNCSGITVDASGNVYVADGENNVIRKITPAGSASTVIGAAGEAGLRLGSDGRLWSPAGIALIGANRLVITSVNAVLIADLP